MSGNGAEELQGHDGLAPGMTRAGGSRLPRSVCPHLEVADGRWRHAGPSRDHRCRAMEPAGQLTTDKQRRLCLGAAHVTCPAFLAARQARSGWSPAGTAASSQVRSGGRWRLLRVSPVVAAPEAGPSVADLLQHRATIRAGLVGLLVVAFVVILVSRPPADHAPGALLVPTPSANATLTIAPSRTAQPINTSTPAALATVRPSDAPGTSSSRPPASTAPLPTAPLATPLTYTVVAGDTLSGIAARYGTTVQAIMDLNALTTTNLRISQVLQIPQAPATALPSLGPAP